MEQDYQQDLPQEDQETSSYSPRPRWQVWGARIALVVFIVMIFLYYINIVRGGA